jgi:hypothetical protein
MVPSIFVIEPIRLCLSKTGVMLGVCEESFWKPAGIILAQWSAREKF